MKTSRRLALEQREQQLLFDSDHLRLQLARQINDLRKPLTWMALASQTLLSLQRPRSALSWASGLWWGWRVLQRVRRIRSTARH
jgi:hypothetical protein